jgi:hypothetical protein
MSHPGRDLLDYLDHNFVDHAGLQELVFALRQTDATLQFDDLGGPNDGRRSRLRELVQYHERRGALDHLRVTAERVIASLAQRRKTGTPFQIPPLPAHFVPRLQVMADLHHRLLSGTAPTGVLAVSAVHALGGIGKLTLAATLAHDPYTKGANRYILVNSK